MISSNVSFSIDDVKNIDGKFVLVNRVSISANSASPVIFIATSAFPTVSSAENAEDIAEGLRGLQEPTVATWTDLKAQLGL